MITITFKRWKYEEENGSWEQVGISDWEVPPRVGEFLRLDGQLWHVSEVIWENSDTCTIKVGREYREEGEST